MDTGSTLEYTMKNWLEATENITFTLYPIGEHTGDTVCIGDIFVADEHKRADFEAALKKVSRKIK